MRSGRRWMVALAGLVMFSAYGCSVPKHTDTLMFGTNTKFALDVSAGPDGNPSITVGYKRQEFVWLPLLVNGAESDLIKKKVVVEKATKGDESNIKVVKEGPGAGDLTSDNVNAKEIKYTGTDKGGTPNVDRTDTYSVLASFGATFGGGIDSTGKSAKAEGGLSQYFATGLAARILAEKGGAQVVSVQPVNTVSEKTRYDAIKADLITKSNIDSIIDYVQDPPGSGTVGESRLKVLVKDTNLGDAFINEYKGINVSEFKDALSGPYYRSVDKMASNIPES